MNTVTFDNKNSYADFGLILEHKEIGKPEPRTNYIDVPARDGHLDLTEAFGEVKYKERTITFYFSYIGSDADWESTLSALHNYLNGQQRKIYFEKNYYWVGRCFVGDAQTKKGIREFTIECDCEPYKYKVEETIVETKRKNFFDYVGRGTNAITTNNNDGSFTINGVDYYGIIGVSKTIFEVGKTYTFSQYVVSASDSGNTPLNFNAVIYYTDNTYIESSIAINGAGKRYAVQLTPTKEIKSVEIRPIKKGNTTTTMTGVIKDIQIEEGTNATTYEQYDTDIVTITNDRKTVTPYIEILSGEPILSWEDKKTGVKYNSVAIPTNGKYLDFKLYEGKNTFTINGGDIRLTYREASL